MGLMKAVVKFLTDPRPVSTLAALEGGRAAAEGIVRKSDEGFLSSPVKGQPCVAFYYQAIHLVGNRAGQMMPRRLRTEETYHAFDLELEDGRLRALPKKAARFGRDQHMALSSAGYQGFRATEQIIPLGTRVRIHGRARKVGDAWTFIYHKLEPIEATVRSEPVPAKRRKKGKKGR